MTSSYPRLALPWQAMLEAAMRDATGAGVEHFLLALCDVGTTVVSETMDELGITRELIEQRHPGLRGTTGTTPSGEQKKGAGLRGDGERLHGFATGLATAWGEPPTSTHYLVAIAYVQPGAFFPLGTTSEVVVASLRRRGVRLPDAEPPEYRPYFGGHSVEVDEDELQPLIDELRRLHPPGSGPRWSFRWTDDEPRRASVSAEEGIDLDAALRQSRGKSE